MTSPVLAKPALRAFHGDTSRENHSCSNAAGLKTAVFQAEMTPLRNRADCEPLILVWPSQTYHYQVNPLPRSLAMKAEIPRPTGGRSESCGRPAFAPYRPLQIARATSSTEQNCLAQELLGQFAPELELKFNSKKNLTAFRRKVFSMQIVLIKTSSAGEAFLGVVVLDDPFRRALHAICGDSSSCQVPRGDGRTSADRSM